jgi:hypothetical protein
MAIVGTFSLRNLVGHHWDSSMGVGFIPQSAWVHLEKDENLVETIQASKVAYANAIESKKWTQYPSITTLKSFMGDIFHIYIYLKKHCLHPNIGM